MLNTSFSSDYISKGRVVSSVNGEIKVINCSVSAFRSIIDCIDGIKSFGLIEEELQKTFPIDGIRNYLDVMVSEKIIIIKNDNSLSVDEIRVLLLGKGRLFEELGTAIDKTRCFRISKFSDAVEAEKEEVLRYDVACVVPEIATYGDMLKINKTMLSSNIPYIPYYFNGSELIVGPFVIPGKSACYECQVRHRMQLVNEKLDSSLRIDTDDLHSVLAAQRVTEDFGEAQTNFLSDMICRDLYRFACKSGKYDLFESEKRFGSKSSKLLSDTVYHATTQCRSCKGMNGNVVFHDGEAEFNIPEYKSIDEEPIKYKVGGLRSLSEEETKEYITKAFSNTGLDISVRRMVHSPFDSILPIYRAFLKSGHGTDTPYYFRDATAHGKGMTETQSYLSAAFELAEHISSYYLGDIPVINSPYNLISDHAVEVKSLAESIYNHNTAFDDFSPDKSVDWVWAKSLVDGEARLVPASMIFLGDVKLQGQFINPSSTGLAAGATLKDAILQGMYEVIEHDAWIIGQSNQIALPFVDYMSSSNEKLKDSVNAVKAMGYRVIFRDYSNDLGFPVFRCWIVNPNNYTHYATSGFGASPYHEIALERAFTEAIQSADVLTDCDKTYFGRASAIQLMTSADSFYSISYFQKKDILGEADLRSMDSYESKHFISVKQAIEDAVETITRRLPGSDILYVNLTKKGLDVPVVRVVITGDIQRLNIPIISVSPRMYDFPVKMGYSKERTLLRDLYLGPYPH